MANEDGERAAYVIALVLSCLNAWGAYRRGDMAKASFWLLASIASSAAYIVTSKEDK